jgi:hypothetical protein
MWFCRSAVKRSVARPTSSVQFVRFTLTPQQKARFAEGDLPVMLGFDHPHYGHLAVMPTNIRQALAGDLAL